MCIGRTIFRTALIGGLAAGGLALAFPDKAVHVFHGMKHRVNAVVAEATDDPVVLRRQLQELADELPAKIAELYGEVSEVDAQIAMITRDTEIAEGVRSEEHTSELQSQSNLVCRLLLEKKKKKIKKKITQKK